LDAPPFSFWPESSFPPGLGENGGLFSRANAGALNGNKEETVFPSRKQG